MYIYIYVYTYIYICVLYIHISVYYIVYTWGNMSSLYNIHIYIYKVMSIIHHLLVQVLDIKCLHMFTTVQVYTTGT